ncbi:hypothetical protein GLP21_08225 [Photobacterium carnosum]|uniref:hypothetical protein n=1 Tax=Photobacterium carnosum TaxID=2023717 RepID=UPI001E4A9AF2|nr:hypothetical protein [Photobacterium carnosum]MCD9523773.1 hypothetical protein [Photobacterium carnosum]MCD9548618.1 hypothetical protein [Photobacterium carnosum]MCF2304974.1 hypothetical protein [Photobacterium carnosum]
MLNNPMISLIVNFVDLQSDQNILPARKYITGDSLSYLPKVGDVLAVEIDINSQLAVSLSINDLRFFNDTHEQPQVPAKCYVVKQITTKLMVNDACDNVDYLLEEVSFVEARKMFINKQ